MNLPETGWFRSHQGIFPPWDIADQFSVLYYATLQRIVKKKDFLQVKGGAKALAGIGVTAVSVVCSNQRNMV